jgi:hypothetical protein
MASGIGGMLRDLGFALATPVLSDVALGKAATSSTATVAADIEESHTVAASQRSAHYFPVHPRR